MPHQTAQRHLALLAIAGLAVSGCRSAPDQLERFWGEEHGEDGGLTTDQLHARLQEFTFLFSGAVQTTGMRMSAGSDDIGLRRRTILRRSNLVPPHFSRNIVPRLKELGVTDEQIDALLVDNPRRFFAGDKLPALS